MGPTTIAAIATPSGFGGIGIIKISGPLAISVANDIFRQGPPETGYPSDRQPRLDSWRIYYGHIVDTAHNRIFDEVILAVMQAPHSYTREDVIEIQAHAGPAVLKSIINLLISKGIRLAEPGEFTRRAFLNGRIDLTRAEAVIDMINAQSDQALEMAVNQMSGRLCSLVGKIRESISQTIAEIEAAVDFPEAVEDEINYEHIFSRLTTSVLEPINALIKRHEEEDILRSGARVLIVGPPNVGKSSLLNCLAGQDRAIVTESPGTTRDIIDVPIMTRGIEMVLTDTAGLHGDPDPIEKIGIEKARNHLKTADVVLMVFDISSPFSPDYIEIYKEVRDKSTILVLNKLDLPADKKTFRPPANWEFLPRVEISALYDLNMDLLKQAIADQVMKNISGGGRLVPNVRHNSLLKEARHYTCEALEALKSDFSPECISIDLRSAYELLGEITGEHFSPDILDKIFSQYCIGK